MSAKNLLCLCLIFLAGACTPQTPAAQSQRLVQKGPAALIYQPARLQTESPLQLDIHTPPGWQLHKAVLVGLSMDMPTLPLFFNRQQNADPTQLTWQTQFLLGACADEQMRWQLDLLFIDEKGAEQRLSDQFVVFRH